MADALNGFKAFVLPWADYTNKLNIKQNAKS